ncbi:MAG: hypothetical protein RLZZ432_999, partial [Chloroflexota bacterium]
PPGLPSAPTALSFVASTPTAGTLSWRAPARLGNPEVARYVVQYKADGGSWTDVPKGSTTERSIALTGLKAATDYSFRVRGENGSTATGDTTYVLFDWGQIAVRTPDPVAPSAPTSLATGSISSSTAGLSWTAPADSGGSAITDYVVETSRDGRNWSAVPHTASASTTMNLSGLAPGTTYLVRIAAKNAVGPSEYLGGSFATLAGPPLAPRNLVASNVASTTLTLAWDLPSSNGGSPITDYRVEVSGNGGSSWTAIPHGASNSPAFAVTGLAAGTTYRFRVSTINAIGASSPSAVHTVTTLGSVPSAPTNLLVKSTTATTVTLSWAQPLVSDGSAVRNYVVEYSTNGGATWVAATKPLSTSKSVTISGFRTKTTYKFRISAVNDVGMSSPSGTVTIKTR